MHLASKVDRSSALTPPFLLISYISATKNCAPSTHRKYFRLWKYSCYDFFHLRYLNCTAVWDCKNLQELREIGAEQGGEVNVLRFDQPWPLILTFSYSLYTYVYTYILYILIQFIYVHIYLYTLPTFYQRSSATLRSTVTSPSYP